MAEELYIADRYVGLQHLRLPGRIVYETDVPEELLGAPVLRFLLQPVLENAILHGLKRGRLHIRISARVEDDTLILECADDGAGITAKRLDAIKASLHAGEDTAPPASGSGIGLTNINSRLTLYYGEEYPIALLSDGESYTRTVIRIPMRWEDA